MTLNEFSAWALSQGTVCKTDGTFCGECVSLINQYLSKVHGINAGAWGHAKDWANTSNPIRQWFVPVNQSQAGDIGISGAVPGNPYGHIWIYQANTILEQNGRVARKVTISPDRNAVVILRPKAGMPQGGSMGKVTTPLLRIIHSEMEGWDLDRTHRGEYDAAFNASWGGADLEAVIWEKWNKNGPFRAQRERNRKFYDQYASVIADLPNRPTKAQLDEALAKLAAEAKKVEKANAEAEAARKALLEEQANKSEDTELIEEGKGFFTKLLKRWGLK